VAYICHDSIEIPFLCSNASQRLVHMSFFSDSQITRPALKINTSQATIVIGPNVISTTSTWQSSGTSVGPGIYHLVLTQSECSSQGGPGYAMLYTSTLTTGPYYLRLYFPRVDSYDTMRMGLTALPNVAHSAAGGLITEGTGTGQLSLSGGSVGLKAQTHSDVTIKGIQNYANISNVTLHAGTHSDVTIKGIQNYANISSVTLNAGTHSGATVQGLSNYANISNVTLHAGTHSNVTIQGLSNYANISSVTLNAGTHSGATVQGLSNYANISNVTLHAGTHSNVTIQGVTRLNSGVTLNANVHSGASVEVATGGIQASSFGAGAIDAVALATDAGQEIADRLIARNIEGGSDTGRIVRDCFSVLRNKAAVDGSRLTVYRTDDSTSAWTADVTTGTDPISGIDPGGV
jgi:hypothetical protein